jgi:hypothetical protein
MNRQPPSGRNGPAAERPRRSVLRCQDCRDHKQAHVRCTGRRGASRLTARRATVVREARFAVLTGENSRERAGRGAVIREAVDGMFQESYMIFEDGHHLGGRACGGHIA